jgi:hypothetical protein
MGELVALVSEVRMWPVVPTDRANILILDRMARYVGNRPYRENFRTILFRPFRARCCFSSQPGVKTPG